MDKYSIQFFKLCLFVPRLHWWIYFLRRAKRKHSSIEWPRRDRLTGTLLVWTADNTGQHQTNPYRYRLELWCEDHFTRKLFKTWRSFHPKIIQDVNGDVWCSSCQTDTGNNLLGLKVGEREFERGRPRPGRKDVFKNKKSHFNLLFCIARGAS